MSPYMRLHGEEDDPDFDARIGKGELITGHIQGNDIDSRRYRAYKNYLGHFNRKYKQRKEQESDSNDSNSSSDDEFPHTKKSETAFKFEFLEKVREKLFKQK